MKNSFSRFVFVALLSTVAGMVFAGENWKAPIPGGANHVSVKTGMANGGDAGIYTQGEGVCQKGRESVTLNGDVLTKCKSDGNTISGKLQPDGRVVSDNGQMIGQIGKDGNFYEKIGGVVKPSEVLVFDSDGKARVLTPEDNGNLCYDTAKSMNQRQIPRGFDAPLCARTMDEAVVQTNPLFGNACENKIEEGLYSKKINGAENNGVKIFKRADKGDGNDKSATLYFDGDEVDAIVHNHPDGSLWPSEADVITALKKNSDVYINNCNGEYSVFSHMDGRVYKIVDGKRIEFEESFPNHVRTNDGHDPYDSKNLAKLRTKAKGAEISLGSVAVAAKIPDLSKLVDAMRRIAECLRRINAMSSKPSEEDYSEYNKLMDKFAEEAEKVEKALEDEIGKMKTEDEKVKFSKELGDLFERQFRGSELCNEILSLQKQIQAKGYGRFTPRNLNLNVNFLK